MRFTIDAEVRGGLRVIPEIADHDLCWLEGRNGIGKSLAVRLLQLISGDQPYLLQPAAWDSLRQLLVHATIRIESLSDGSTIEVELVPGEWPDDPTLGLGPSDSATINGTALQIADIRRYLRVFRVGGDESVVSRFRSRVDADRQVADRQSDWLTHRLDEQAALCDQVRQDLDGLSLDRWQTIAGRVESETAAGRAATESLNRLQVAIGLLNDADALRVALAQLRAEGPSLADGLARISSDIDAIRSEREQLDQERLRLAPAAQRLEELLGRQRALAKVRERDAAAAQSALVAANDACRLLGVAADRAALDALGRLAAEERAAILRDRSALELLPHVTALIDDVKRPLVPLVGSSLDTEIVAVVGRSRISVGSLRDGLGVRERELAGHEQFAVLAEMERRLSDLDDRRRAVRRAKTLLTRAQAAADDLQRTERRWSALTAEIDQAQPANLIELAAQIEELDRRHIELVRQQAELIYRQRALSDAGPEESLEERLRTITARLDSDFPEVTLATADQERAKLQVEFSRRQAALADLLSEQRALQERLDQVVLLLSSAESYGWLRQAIGDLLPGSGTDVQSALGLLTQLSGAIGALEEAADALRTEAASVRDALRLISDALGSGRAPATGSRHVPALTQHYEHSLGDLLRDTLIQQALFPEGQFERLDLLRSEITWRDEAGLQRKPLEAFSSGERAFAFVLASILQQAGDETPNRLMVLDEFGAFVDAEGRERLKQFLEEQVLAAKIADQVVVMLPLREGLTDEQARAVQERDYFMQPIGGLA